MKTTNKPNTVLISESAPANSQEIKRVNVVSPKIIIAVGCSQERSPSTLGEPVECQTSGAISSVENTNMISDEVTLVERPQNSRL